MISYIKGELTQVWEDRIVVETGGIGFSIRVPSSVLSSLSPVGSIVTIHTYFQVQEDAMQLFGFCDVEELSIFRMLIRISGIGPKAALGLLSALSADELRLAVMTGDAKAIAKAPGIGKKTAEKLILELKDKFSPEELLGSALAAGGSTPGTVPGAGRAGASAAGHALPPAASDAVQALIALGYSSPEALRTVHGIEKLEELTTEDILSAALQRLAPF